MISLPKAIQKIRNILPKTGQITSYQAGDDGQYEAGWWRRRLNANNKTRFVAKTIAGDSVICDYATRLMWKASDEAGTYTWANALIQAEGLTYAGFSDWRLPNFFEFLSIFNFGAFGPSQYPGFNFSDDEIYYWTSTTNPEYANYAFIVSLYLEEFVHQAKTVFPHYVRACREF